MADTNTGGNVAAKMQGIPMQHLIAAPLKAACDSQFQLAQSSLYFIKNIGFLDGDFAKELNLVKFKLNRPVETPEGITSNTIEVQAPVLGLVPIPSLLIDNVNIDFQMEISAVTSETEKKTKSGEFSASADMKLGLFGSAKVEVHGNVSSSRENTRSTNQTAKYHVQVSAIQQPPTEGLSKLMDIVASCTAPLSVT